MGTAHPPVVPRFAVLVHAPMAGALRTSEFRWPRQRSRSAPRSCTMLVLVFFETSSRRNRHRDIRARYCGSVLGRRRQGSSCIPVGRVDQVLRRRSTSCISCRCRTGMVRSCRSWASIARLRRTRRLISHSFVPRRRSGYMSLSRCSAESTPTIPSPPRCRPPGVDGDCLRVGRAIGPCPMPSRV